MKSRRRIKGGGLAPRYYSKQMASAVDVVSPPIPRENRNTSARPRPLELPASLRINRRHTFRVPIRIAVTRAVRSRRRQPGGYEITRGSCLSYQSRTRITHYKSCLPERKGRGGGGRRESLFTSGRVKTLFSIFDGTRNAVARLF